MASPQGVTYTVSSAHVFLNMHSRCPQTNSCNDGFIGNVVLRTAASTDILVEKIILVIRLKLKLFTLINRFNNVLISCELEITLAHIQHLTSFTLTSIQIAP